MRNFLFILLFLPIVSSAQKYGGKYYNTRTKVGYNVLLLIRPDSTVSITLETINPRRDKQRQYDRNLYYDYHGNITKSISKPAIYIDSSGTMQRLEEGETIFYLDTKSIFVFSPRDEVCDFRQIRALRDTVVVVFDSTRILLNRNISWSYGSIHDSLRLRISSCYTSGNPETCNPFSYPVALRDSNHVSLPIGAIYLPVDSVEFKSAKQIKLDLGYVNPVTNESVSFNLPYGKFPYIDGDRPVDFKFFIKGSQLYFFDYHGAVEHLWGEFPLILTEFK